MDEQLLEHSSDIDARIPQAIEAVLDAQVIGVDKMVRGDVNIVYRVSTDNGEYIIRVFRRKQSPDGDKLAFIESAFDRLGIRHAKTLFYTRDTALFKYGYMIAECVPGLNGHDAIVQGATTLEDFHNKLGKLLRQVHSIEFKEYGVLTNGHGTHTNYSQHQLDDTARLLKEVGLYEELGRPVYKLIQSIVPFESRLHPVLVHTDATPGNCIYTPSGEVVLIDWDNALASTWLTDYAELTYTGSHLNELGPRDVRVKQIKEAFFKGYGEVSFTPDELIILERVVHVCKAINLLGYFRFVVKQDEWFNKTVERIKELI
jgi:Ser/Thr protein kinase RdoA (MazF antagonist)